MKHYRVIGIMLMAAIGSLLGTMVAPDHASEHATTLAMTSSSTAADKLALPSLAAQPAPSGSL